MGRTRRLGVRGIARVALVLVALSLVAPVAVIRADAADHLSVTIGGSPTAGSPVTVTVQALDSSSSVDTLYAGTVTFTSSDTAADLPGDYTFDSGDSGTHDFNVTFKTAGNRSVTATDAGDGSINGTDSAVVHPDSASDLVLDGYPTSTTAGVAHSFSVEAVDPYGNTATGYLGTVTFTSSDSAAVLPDDYTFASGDHGVQSFSATLNTTGTRSITATDTSTSSINASQIGIDVNAGGLDHFDVTGFPDPSVAGASHTFTVAAKDGAGNTLTGYTGTIHFTSTDGQAVLPSTYTFSASDNGDHTFSATLETVGNQSISVADGGTTDSEGGINVNPAPASVLIVGGFGSAATAGLADSFSVTAKDPYNNTATGYTGTVHFTSSDGAAVLPANYLFVAGNNGTKAFSATLNTTGTQSITATDMATSSIKGTQPGIVVSGGALNHFVVAGFADPVVAGASDTFTVTAQDSLNNTLAGYTGTVHFTSSDGHAALPSTYHFVPGDNGVHTFSATLKTAGSSQSISATDGGASGSQNGILVNPAAAAQLAITGLYPDPTVANVVHTLTVTLTDAFGNVATGYRGTVHVTSSDLAAVLPASHPFSAGDAGVHVFSVTLKTSGVQAIATTDTVNGTLTDSQGGISVSSASAASLVVSGYPHPTGVNVTSSVTVTVKDGSNNTATAYTGTVHLTTNGGTPSLPGPYTFKGSDNGVHTFNGISFDAPSGPGR